MANFTESRKYQRCLSSICRVNMSVDRKRWEEIDFIDISAGGLGFASKKQFDMNNRMYFNISVINGFSEFNMSFEGIVVRKKQGSITCTYGVKFDNINKYHQIQLDEIIKSKIWHTQQAKNSEFEDGTYTFMFLPRRRRKTRIPTYR